MQKRRLSLGSTSSLNVFVLFYLALSIGLLTLSPFVWDALHYWPLWVWRFSVADVARNLLLFFPFGLALRHSQRWRHEAILLCGFLLSLLVESGQLFIAWRTSNLVDLVANSAGALLGSLFHYWVFSRTKSVSSEVSLACMFVPLGWVSAMRSLWDPLTIITVLLSAIASLSLITSIPQSKKTITAAIWSSLFFVPVLDTDLIAGGILLAAAPIIILLILKMSAATVQKVVSIAAVAGFGLVLSINIVWYLTQQTTAWTNNEHLRLSEVALSTMTVVVSLIWWRDRRQKN